LGGSGHGVKVGTELAQCLDPVGPTDERELMPADHLQDRQAVMGADAGNSLHGELVVM
jgi:hypothetical protein